MIRAAFVLLAVSSALAGAVQSATLITPPQEVLLLRETASNGGPCFLVAAGATTLLSMRQEGRAIDVWVGAALQRYLDAGWAADDAHVQYALRTYEWTQSMPANALDVLLSENDEAQQSGVAIAVMRHCTRGQQP